MAAFLVSGTAMAARPAHAEWLEVRSSADGAQVARWKLRALAVRRCDEVVFDARLGAVPVRIVATATTSRLLDRRLDFERSRVDGRRSFGHDGLVSRDYVAKNLAHRPYLARLRVEVGRSSYNVPPRAYPFLLDPAFGSTGMLGCEAQAYWAPEQRTLVLQLDGGLDSGWYRTLLFLTNDGLSAVYVVHCSGDDPRAMCSLGRDLFAGPDGSPRAYRLEVTEARK